MSPIRPRARRSLLGRLQSLDLAILIGVVAVIVIVSVPRLTAFASRENEADAQRLVRRLARVFDDDSALNPPPKDTLELFERLPRASRRQFEDRTVVDVGSEGGRDRSLLLRHGYYFEFVRLPTFAGDTRGVMAVRAWPERRSTASLPSFFGFSGTVVMRHAALNPAPGGEDAPPQLDSPLALDMRARGWMPVAASDVD